MPEAETLDTAPNTTTTEEALTESPPASSESIETVKQVYNQALRDVSQRAAQAEQELERLRNAPAPTRNEQDLEADKELLFSNPRKLIREEMEEIIKPLNQFTQQITREQAITQIKARLATDPRYSLLNNPEVSQYLDQVVSGFTVINESSLSAAYNMAVGLYVQNNGTLPALNNQQLAPNTTQQMNPLPPHVRPAAPIKVPTENKNKRRALTEQERYIARLNNMNDDQYLDEMELLPQDVVKGKQNV